MENNLQVLTIEEAEELVKENKSIGYFIDEKSGEVKQTLNLITGETRVVAKLF